MSGYAWHASIPGDFQDGQVTGPYCYDCVPKARAPWRHRLPQVGDEALTRLEAEARRHLGRRFSWVRALDDPQTGARSLRIQGLPLADRPTPSCELSANAKAVLIDCSGADGQPPQRLSIPLATEPALVIAQVGVLVAPPSGAGGAAARAAR